MRNIEIRYGLFGGGILCLWTLAEYALGFHTTHHEAGKISGYLQIIALISVIYFALYEVKEKRRGGSLPFTQGLASGIVVSLIAAGLLTLFYAGYYQWINPDWIGHAIAQDTARLTAAGKSPAEIAARVEQMRSLSSYPLQLSKVFATTVFTGGIMSALAAAIVRRDPQGV